MIPAKVSIVHFETSEVTHQPRLPNCFTGDVNGMLEDIVVVLGAECNHQRTINRCSHPTISTRGGILALFLPKSTIKWHWRILLKRQAVATIQNRYIADRDFGPAYPKTAAAVPDSPSDPQLWITNQCACVSVLGRSSERGCEGARSADDGGQEGEETHRRRGKLRFTNLVGGCLLILRLIWGQ